MKWLILVIVTLIAAAVEEEKDSVGHQVVPPSQQVCEMFSKKVLYKIVF